MFKKTECSQLTHDYIECLKFEFNESYRCKNDTQGLYYYHIFDKNFLKTGSILVDFANYS